MTDNPQPEQRPAPRISFVSLGCPKALVDSERILTRLRAEGYELARTHANADAVIVNTCGFLDSAKKELLAAIGEAMSENGRVIVTGCMGAEPGPIRDAFPNVAAITGPQAFESVMEAVRAAAPAPRDPFVDLIPGEGVRLTPRHYAYLKIAEGCDNRCTFCIIPALRGRLVSRSAGEVLREAERLVKAGVKELIVIAQDTSAYGLDLKYAASPWRDREVAARFLDVTRELGTLGAWVRLQYVYPYPHVDEAIALMNGGNVLPYIDVPFQHASPAVLKAMRRPAAQEKTLERIRAWRAICPEIDHPLDLHRRLSRRDGGGFPLPPRLARRGEARPGRRLQVRAGQGRARQRSRARARAGRYQGGAPQALHGARAGDQRKKTRRQGRQAARGHRRRGRRARGQGPQQGRRAWDRRRSPRRDAPHVARGRHRDREDRPRRRLRSVGDGGLTAGGRARGDG